MAAAKKTSPAEKAAPAKAAPAKKAPAAKETPATKAPARKVSAEKAPAEKAPAKKAPAKKAPAKKAPASTAAVAEQPPAKQTSAKKAPAKHAPAKQAAAGSGAARKAGAGSLRVREDESPWTADELAEVQSELREELERLKAEIVTAEQDLAAMLLDASDSAGDDQADAGSKTFEREHEMSLANNARDMLLQVEHALHRIDDGTYGVCESCGNPIGKARLQAFPRATLCLSCKQREERR